jgi:hypothetical protein
MPANGEMHRLAAQPAFLLDRETIREVTPIALIKVRVVFEPQ